MGKRSATTRISRTFLRGNTKATALLPRRNCIASRWCSKPSSLRREATNELQTQSLAAKRSENERQARPVPGDECFAEHVVPRNARRGQRRVDRERRRADRVRLGLPRRDLRDVF